MRSENWLPSIFVYTAIYYLKIQGGQELCKTEFIGSLLDVPVATVGSIIIWELSTSAIFYIKFGMLDINLFRKDCSDGW